MADTAQTILTLTCHVYQMAVRGRVRAKPGYCPYCSGRKRPERPIRLD